MGGLLTDIPNFPPDVFLFETLSFNGYLRVLGEGGVAVFRRRQRIRFLDDGVGLFIDRIWGDGVLLAGYSVSRGIGIIEALRTDKGYALLLSLPRRFNRGDVLDIETERRIVGAFTDRDGYWELAMNVPTHLMSLHISVPPRRRMSRPEIVAPAKGDLSFKLRGSGAEFAVRGPAVHVPYRVEWRWKRKSRAIAARPSRG